MKKLVSTTIGSKTVYKYANLKIEVYLEKWRVKNKRCSEIYFVNYNGLKFSFSKIELRAFLIQNELHYVKRFKENTMNDRFVKFTFMFYYNDLPF